MVTIKDMKMPKCCSECPLFHFIIDINGDLHFICKCGNMEICGDFENERTDFCPLIEEEKPILDKIRAEIEENAYPIVHGVNNHEKGMTLYGILQVIDKYKAESEYDNRPISKFKIINDGNRTAHFNAYYKCCNCGYQEPRLIGNIYNYCPKCGDKKEVE